MKENIRLAKRLVAIARVIVGASADYIYDPEHKKHPGGVIKRPKRAGLKPRKKMVVLAQILKKQNLMAQ